MSVVEQFPQESGRIIGMGYLATFYTHYGAMRFIKYCEKAGIDAKMAPVPRELSASCGVCVRFEADRAPEEAEHEDMERCYRVGADGAYLPAGRQ